MQYLRIAILSILHGISGIMIGGMIDVLIWSTNRYARPSEYENCLLDLFSRYPRTTILVTMTTQVAAYYTADCLARMYASGSNSQKHRTEYLLAPHLAALAVTSNLFTLIFFMDASNIVNNSGFIEILAFMVVTSSASFIYCICRITKR